jgi:hypothetical protein
MKKLFVHLSLLCLMALLLVPMVACNRGDSEVEETPAATTETTTMEEPTTMMDTGMTTDMGTTDTMTTDSMTTETTPPAQ